MESTSNLKQQVPALLPPMYLSKLILSQKRLENNSALEKIKYVVKNTFLVTQDTHASFEILNTLAIRNYKIIAYYASVPYRNSIVKAFDPDKAESQNENKNGLQEFLIFINLTSIRLPQKTLIDPDIYVLSTSKAYKAIGKYCSPGFPITLSTHLKDNIIKIKKIQTGMLWGNIGESEVNLKGVLPLEIEQRGMLCRNFTATLEPFVDCIKGSNVKVNFSEKGVLIYRDLSLESYIQVIETFSSIKIHDYDTWGVPELPKQFTKVDLALANILDRYLLLYLLGIESEDISNIKFDLGVSEKLFKNGDEYRFYYVKKNSESTESYPIPLSDPYSPPTIKDLKRFLDRYTISWPRDYDVFKDRLPAIEYKIGGIWLNSYVLECVEGSLVMPDGEVYFIMGETWYRIDRTYVDVVNNTLSKIMDSSLLTLGQPGYLHKPWNTELLKENPYNASYAKLQTADVNWFEGNLRTLKSCEIFDILGTDNDSTFIYHVKKEFNATIRDAATQLLMSARILRDIIDHGQKKDVELHNFAQRIDNSGNLFNAFDKKLHFVIAFPMQPDFKENIMSSKSLTAKEELIRAKEGIEKLGFVFKICPIQIVKIFTIK